MKNNKKHYYTEGYTMYGKYPQKTYEFNETYMVKVSSLEGYEGLSTQASYDGFDDCTEKDWWQEGEDKEEENAKFPIYYVFIDGLGEWEEYKTTDEALKRFEDYYGEDF